MPLYTWITIYTFESWQKIEIHQREATKHIKSASYIDLFFNDGIFLRIFGTPEVWQI